jgi:tetratricopeptide (TPR) repeat protein
MAATADTNMTAATNTTAATNMTATLHTTRYNSINALVIKGAALLHLGKDNESIAYFDKALAVDPTSFYGSFFKGAALLHLGKANESIAYFAIDCNSGCCPCLHSHIMKLVA